MTNHIQIETPRGAVFVGPNGKAELKFNSNFAPRLTKQYTAAQKFIDSEVLRYSEPFTPLLTGTLIKSGILGTVIGSGKVSWIMPYAKRQYYRGRRPGTQQAGPLRGRYWFERMKAIRGKTIIAGAKKLAGGAQ
jgi:hypothetical protein